MPNGQNYTQINKIRFQTISINIFVHKYEWIQVSYLNFRDELIWNLEPKFQKNIG